MERRTLADHIGFRITFAIFVTIAYCLCLFSKLTYGDKIVKLYESTGYREPIPNGVLTDVNGYGYLFGILLFILLLFLPQMMRSFQRLFKKFSLTLNDGNLERCLYIVIIYWIIGLLGWSIGKLDFLYLATFLTVGGFYGVVEGVWKTPLQPKFMNNDKLNIESKVELIKFEDNKWWRGLNLFWIVIVGIAVTGAISFALSPTSHIQELSKVPGYNSAQIAYLVLSIVPGIALFIWYFIKRVNYLHRLLEGIYTNRSSIISSST